MIGKLKRGTNFGNCLRYVVNKVGARILYAEGVRIHSARTLTQDFNLQRRMRPELNQAVGHLIISWNLADLPLLNDKTMLDRAMEYLRELGIQQTQFVAVRHNDSINPHLHLIYNRVDNNGKTISHSFGWIKALQVSEAMNNRFGYKPGEGKALINRQSVKGWERTKLDLYDAINSVLQVAIGWPDFSKKLAALDISFTLIASAETGFIKGIVFKKGSLHMKGSAIDQELSFPKIHSRLKESITLRYSNKSASISKESISEQADESSLIEKERITDFSTIASNYLIQKSELEDVNITSVEDTRRKKKKRKMKPHY